MIQYIDKSAVVAEIKRRNEILVDMMNRLYYASNYNEWKAEVKGYGSLISFINSLEVKEVDFETAFAASIDHFDEKNNYGQWTESDLRQFAKHFFELGLEVQEGE